MAKKPAKAAVKGAPKKAKQDVEGMFAEADAKAAPVALEVDIEAIQAGLGVRGY